MQQKKGKDDRQLKSWGHSVNNDVATFRVMEAGRNDENFRDLIEKEGEQGQENEREVVPIEEPRGDRTVVFPSHAWNPELIRENCRIGT